MFCLRVQRGRELPCRQHVQAEWGTDAELLFDVPRILVLRLRSLPPDAPTSHVSAAVARLYLLPEVLQVSAYIAHIDVAPSALQAIAAHFSADRSRVPAAWQAALRLWERCCNRGAEVEGERRTFVVRCHKRKEKQVYSEASPEMEQAMNAGLRRAAQGFQMDLGAATVRVCAVLSTRIVYGIDLPRQVTGAKRGRAQGPGVGAGSNVGGELMDEGDVDLDVDLDVDAVVLKGALKGLDGFSEEKVRAEAKAMKVGIDALVAVMRGRDADTLVVDVRSPVEFLKAHIPISVNIPLFSNKERSDVGTTFKRKGRDAAIELGMAIVVPKLCRLKATFRKALEEAGKKRLLMVCFRGGFRSSSVAWYIRRELGVDMRILEGGYKGFKRHARGLWDEKEGMPKIVVVGGRTGTGKTRLLEELQTNGRQVIDLEGLARHKGSTFGRIPFELRGFQQPSSEMFLNLVAEEWLKLDTSQPVFVEDEGQHIGVTSVPKPFYANVLRSCDLVLQLVLDEALRIRILTEDYANKELIQCPSYTDAMVASVLKAEKKLGPARAAQAVDLMRKSRFEDFAKLMLTYYDELYDKHIASASGTGAGKGVRSCPIVPIQVKDSGDGTFNPGDILDRVDKIVSDQGWSK